MNQWDESGARAGDEGLTRALKTALDAKGVPASVQARLDRTYDSLGKIPQERPVAQGSRGAKGAKGVRRSALVVGIAAACAMFAGAAFAVGSFVSMTQGDAPFFAEDKNLPVFDSMEPGARTLIGDVGQTAQLDGTEVTLDSISCDRNVANLYLTLRKPDGFSMEELANYAGSEEGEWAKLQNALPLLRYSLTNSDGSASSGDVRRLDAYLEDGAVKCLMRIVPEATMGSQVTLDIQGFDANQEEPVQVFQVGLDLSNVPEPRELGAQSIAFETTQGVKELQLERFTVSDLGCVMVARSQNAMWTDDEGQTVSGTAPGAMDARLLKVTDEAGNVLHPVDAGDGAGSSDDEAQIIEFAGMASDAQAVTLTPVLADEEAMEADRLARVAAIAAGEGVPENEIFVDVTQPGAKIPLTELGGYEVTGWNVDGNVVSIALAPYGWVPAQGVPELIPDGEVPALAETWTDPDTGQSGEGLHSAIRYFKWDYVTGNVVQMDAYYQADASALQKLTSYHASVYPSGWYVEQSAASCTFSLVEG